MDALLSAVKKVLSPIVDALHLRGVASTVYRYLLNNPFMFWVTFAFAILLFVAFILIIVLAIKSHKRKKALRKAMKPAPEQATPQPEAQKEEAAPVSEVAEEPAPIQEVAEEVVEQPAEEPAPAQEVAEEVVEQPAEEVVEEAAPAVVESTEKVEKVEKEPKPAKKSPAKKTPVPAPVVKKENAEEKKQTKYRGKWVLYKVSAQLENGDVKDVTYSFELRASNGEKLLESQEYTTLSGAKKGVETYVSNIKEGNFKVSLTKKGTYIFKLLNAKNMLLCTGENYTGRARCESAIDSTKRFAETAVVDNDVQEVIVKASADDEVATVAPATDSAVGKWVVSKQTDDMGNESYFFELFANNGEKLLSSEDYTSQSGALSGLETHKKNIEKGNFRILPTKRGDYIFKLLNGNNQLLCLGEHYKTRRQCQSAVDSVKRFALSSPIVNDEE